MASDENVAFLLSIVDNQLDPTEAAQLLKISDNSVESAVNKFYETDPSNLRKLLTDSVPRWDETAFASGRYGKDDTASGQRTFSIDYGPGFENYPHSNVQSRAPTRPPSRTSMHSNLSTHHGDAPMQSIEGMQETGLIGSKAAFGPANKDQHYDTMQWAMVPTATEPAILKPSPRFNYLPALIAILHSIPLYRNALLSANITQRNYWMGDDWWKGSPALPSRIIEIAERDRVHGLDILYEAQRLMAFLDQSDRAYATVSSMLELDAWKESRPALEDDDDDLLKFLIVWSAAFQAQAPDAQLDGVLRSVVSVGDNRMQNFVLDASVVRESTRTDPNLYDVLDDHLFTGDGRNAHIAEISKVLILRLTSATTNAQGLGCRVPATLYADRYLESNKSVIDGMFSDMEQYNEELDKISNTSKRLKYHTPKKDNTKPVETLKLLESTMKAFEPRAGEYVADATNATVLAQLHNVYQSIESKLAALDEQTKEIRETISSISGRFKPVVDDGAENLIDLTETTYPEGQTPQDAMQHPYHLCGVATHLGVVYLLHPDAKSGTKQWWRVQYDTETSSPSLRHDRLTLQEVVERASTESASALLIYAHPSATSATPVPLAKPLDDFVKKDNWAFEEELQKNATGWEHMDYEDDAPAGTWDKAPPDYEYDWHSVSARQFHSNGNGNANANANEGNVSSATLTPNTEMGDAAGVREMVEINGGMDALTGARSRGSSATVEGDSMDVDGEGDERQGRVRVLEVEAEVDMETDVGGEGAKHIEVVKNKGG